MKTFTESGFTFVFDNQWNVIKYDNHRFYKVLSGHYMSGVDFAGIRKEEAYLIEIKNYKQYKSKAPLKSTEEFIDEIKEKAKDSIRLITVINKYMNRKLLYRTFYSLVSKFNWLQPEWYFWTELHRITVEQKNGTFLLLIESDYDLIELNSKIKKALTEYYKTVIVLNISDSDSIRGITISQK